MPPALRAVSLFSGAGGLDLGLSKAGFQFALHIEHDEDSCATLKDNGFENVRCEDVDGQKIGELLASGAIDLVVGGPPCQPFSKSSQWATSGAKGFGDDRATTIDDYIEVVDALKPRAFLLENVPQFDRLGGVKRIMDKLGKESGGSYSIASSFLNASEFGVAQNRVRIFIVGLRDLDPFTFPKGRFGGEGRPLRSSWDYLSQIPEPKSPDLRGKWTPLLPSIPPGSNYLHHTNRGSGLPLFGWRTRYWSFLYKLDPNSVAPTIVANPSQNNGPFHWTNRELSLAEIAALQSFPRSYKFVGDALSVRRQIGNAVPPLLAEHLGRALIRALGGNPSDKVRLLPPRAKTSPKLPTLEPVPGSFQCLIGDYQDHPGTGKGPRPRG